VTAEIGLAKDPADGGFALTAVLRVTLPENLQKRLTTPVNRRTGPTSGSQATGLGTNRRCWAPTRDGIIPSPSRGD